MSTPDIYDFRRTVKHDPKVVVSRGRRRLMMGEPVCAAPTAPGSTTSDPNGVTCKACLALRLDSVTDEVAQ